jgi:CheY-like chemotaxis protein
MSKTVLVADDSPTIRSMMRACLKTLAVTVVEASRGDEAWDKLQAAPVDLLITDCNMAGITGLELLRKVRRDRRFNRLPTIMVTTEADKGGGLSAGANIYLTKPFRPDELLQSVRQLLA